MIKLSYLEPFDTYRTRPPVIMPEDKQNRKKFQAFMVLAPSVEAELQYLATTKVFSFRNLYKYFIDKRVDFQLYGRGRQVQKPDEHGEITGLLGKYKRGALRQVDGITSYLPSSSVRPLKNLNVLVEANYITEQTLNNPNDRRMMSYRAKEMIKTYHTIYESALPSGYLGNYTVHILIPLELWIREADLGNPSGLMKTSSRNPMGHILAYLSTKAGLEQFKDAHIILAYKNLVLPMQYNATPTDTEGSKDTFILDEIKRFMLKAKNLHTTVDEEDEHASQVIEKAEKSTREDLAVDTVLKKSKVDPDQIPVEKKEKIQKAVVQSVETSNPELKQAPDDHDEQDPEIDIAGAKVDTEEEIDVLLAAKAEGQSVQSYKRNEMLKEKYKELKIGDLPLTDVIKEEDQYHIPDKDMKADTVNDDMKNIKSYNFEKAYNQELAQKDLVNVLLHFSKVHPAMFLNKDIKIEDASTPTDRVWRYTVEFEDETRKRHKFSFLMPKMFRDKYFYLSDQEMNLVHQKFPYPVTKVAPNKCQAVSNYNKIFTERYGMNLSPRITKIKKVFMSPDCPRNVTVDRGDATILNHHYLTSIEYDEIGSSILKISMTSTGKDIIRMYFVTDEALAVIPMDKMPDEKITGEQNLLPLAVETSGKDKKYYFISGTSNKIYDQDGISYGELSEFLMNYSTKYNSTLASEFENLKPGSQYIYARSTIMAEDIPTILVLGAADPGGLQSVLQKGKINYRFTEKREQIDRDTQGMVTFADGYLIFDRYPYENSLLMNGLSVIPTKEFNFLDMGLRDTYVEIFDLMYGRRNLIDGLQTFYYMFVDPITEDVLQRLHMPTDFTRLMLYCVGVLADNTYQIDSDYHNSRIRSNEIVYAYLYKELADAWGLYKDGRNEKFSIPEDAVIKKLLTANVVDPHSELNLTLEAENDRQVKLKGPSGMNEDHSFTIEKRAYHPSMRGIIGMNSTPSGSVGINRHMTLDCNILDARGFLSVGKGDYSGAELATPGELMQPFGPESSDVERLAMGISQSKHVVPVASSGPSPVTYDMERVMPYISNDFAKTAKKNGKVVALENDVLMIQYDDGTYDDIDLSERPAKNTDGGFYIMNHMSTDLKVGSRVKQGDIIAYDKKYISDHDMFGDPVANVGTLARVAVETNGGVYEDACFITDRLAHRMMTNITKQKRVILSKFANIKYIAKVGQELKANDPILLFDDTSDEFSSQLLSTIAAEAGDDDEIIATGAPIVTKVSGTIKDIRIYYTVPTSEMTPSLEKIVNDYVKVAQKREKTINKYHPLSDSDVIIKTSQMLVPDSQGKVKGVKIDEGVIIDFYIEYKDVMAPGDKLNFASPLKGIVSDIIPEGLEAYTEFNPERKIDAVVSCIGVYKRMTLDFAKMSMLNKILVERKRQMKEKYGQRIKDELKKK